MSVRLEKEGNVGIIVLDRPPANSYDYAFLREFASAIDDARARRRHPRRRRDERFGEVLLGRRGRERVRGRHARGRAS